MKQNSQKSFFAPKSSFCQKASFCAILASAFAASPWARRLGNFAPLSLPLDAPLDALPTLPMKIKHEKLDALDAEIEALKKLIQLDYRDTRGRSRGRDEAKKRPVPEK